MKGTPYYEDDSVTLYLADFREVTHELMVRADAIITDPPYGETSLEWDRWPHGWPSMLADISPSMWCFGSFRMFMDNLSDFDRWRFSHEIVWQKQSGTGFATDKFRRVHELATFWYQGEWRDIRHEVPRVVSDKPHRGKRSSDRLGAHLGDGVRKTWVDDGMRMMTTVMSVRNTHRRAVHPTQKPLGIVAPLIDYSVPIGGLVFDPFAGSGTTLLAARSSGRRAIGCEINEKYAEAAARRLSQQTFDLEGIA